MKKFSYYFMLFATMILCGGMLAACSDDDENDGGAPAAKASLEVSALTSDAVSAQIEVLAENLQECAYMVKGETDTVAPNMDIIFAKGTHFTPKSAKDTLVITDLEANTTYNVFVVGKLNDEKFFDKVASTKVTTSDFTEVVTVTKRMYDGFAVHIKPSAEMKEKKNAIRFTRGVLPMYNMFKMQGISDADMLLQNGGDSRVATDDLTYIFDEAHSIIEDPDTGEEYPIDDPIVPGEPSVFISGEFETAESEWGWGEGYFNPLFDRAQWEEDMMGGDEGGLLLNSPVEGEIDEDKYWTGHHSRSLVFAKQPTLLDGKVNFETPKLSPINATLRFTPDENVKMFCVLICDDALLNNMIMPLLDNDEKYLQWFISSNMAFSQLGAQSFSEPIELTLDNFYEADAIQPNIKFHVLITALGDENGTAQSFQHIEFTTPERTKKAPELAVTPTSNPSGVENPYEVWFNIKSVGECPVEKAKFVANYERDMEYMLNHGYDAATLAETKGDEFSYDAIEDINSPEGLNMKFTTRADATTYLAVIGYNDEGLNSEGVMAKAKSIAVPAQEQFDSPLFKGLEGDWTASVLVSRWNNRANAWVEDSVETEFKVTIGKNPEYPATLPEEVYGLYEKMSKAEVDALYEGFKQEAVDYAKKLKEQNNLLCTGFDIEGKNNVMQYKTPYELFTDAKYNGYNNEALYYDFGPKWFLHIDKDGTVTAPIEVNLMDPMSNWKEKYGRRQTVFFAGMGESSFLGNKAKDSDKFPAFPVEVSKDMKTITINPILAKNNDGNEENFYPSAITTQNGQVYPAGSCKSVSKIVLTKGWNEAKHRAVVNHGASQFIAPGMPEAHSSNGVKVVSQTRPSARTSFVKAPYNCKRVTISHLVTADEFKSNMIKICNAWLKANKK